MKTRTAMLLVLAGAMLACGGLIIGCQASTTVTGAKAQASSVTRTTSIKTGAAPALPPQPTIRIRVGPRPANPEPAK